MSTQTDSFGNQGIYLDNKTLLPCPSDPKGKYDTSKCHFEINTRSQAAVGGFGKPMDRDPKFEAIRAAFQRQSYRGGCFTVEQPKFEDSIKTKIECASPTYQWDQGCFTNKDGEHKFVSSIKKDKCVGPTYSWNEGCFTSPTGNWRDALNDIKTEGECAAPTYKWKPDYNTGSVFDDKTLGDIIGHINNGRVGDVNIFDNVKVGTREDVMMKRDNQETAVKGIVEETALSKYFFSSENTNGLQQTIRYMVYQKTDEVIDYQSPQELYVVMRSVLLQHANFKVSSKELLNEIHKLNKIVSVYCVNEVSSNVVQYKGYIRDVEKLPTPIDRPSFNESGSRNRSHDMSNHIAPTAKEGWQSRHLQ
jgi:hypothetical protein